MAETKITDELPAYFRRRPGLKLPYAPGELAVLDDPIFIDFIGRDQHDKYIPQFYIQTAIVVRMCLVFSTTEYRARNVGDDSEYGPLSAPWLHMVEYELSDQKIPKEECKHDNMLRKFVKLLLTARRDYLVDHPERVREMPADKLVRMVHSCLLEFKWRSLKGLEVPLEENERWLDFEIGVEDAADTVKRCNERRWDKDGAV